MSPDASTSWRPSAPVSVALTIGPLRRGPGDPAHQVASDGTTWRTSRLESGPVTYRLRQRGPQEIECAAWGDGADELVAMLPELLGERDDVDSFEPTHPLVRDACRRHPGLRISRTKRVMESLVPAVLEQRVLGIEAFASWRRLLRAHGDEAPGPAPTGMRVPPSAITWRRVPSWEWHRVGVDPGRSRTTVTAAKAAVRLEEATYLEPCAAERRLRAIPGIGVWTAAEVAGRAFGDADAVPVGDYHLAAAVGWTFLGEPIDDDAMLEVLEPFRPHRFRVLRLLAANRTLVKPRRGPRMPRQDHRGH